MRPIGNSAVPLNREMTRKSCTLTTTKLKHNLPNAIGIFFIAAFYALAGPTFSILTNHLLDAVCYAVYEQILA